MMKAERVCSSNYGGRSEDGMDDICMAVLRQIACMLKVRVADF